MFKKKKKIRKKINTSIYIRYNVHEILILKKGHGGIYSPQPPRLTAPVRRLFKISYSKRNASCIICWCRHIGEYNFILRDDNRVTGLGKLEFQYPYCLQRWGRIYYFVGQNYTGRWKRVKTFYFQKCFITVVQ